MGVLALLALSIALRAEPARVVLRERDRVELRIPVPGAPADASVEIWSSVGTVVNLRRESRELFRATWKAPPERFPQVALLLATLRSGGAEQRAWLSLPLIASENLQITTKPRARVELSLAGASYGPVRADRAGKTKIPVLVPPGHRTALVRVRDPFGNVSETSVDLRPPPFSRVRLLAFADRASWTDAEPVQLEIFAVTAQGGPAAAADLILSADRGKLGPPQQTGPGVFRVAFHAPDSAGAPATIRAAVSPDAQGETVTLALLPGPLPGERFLRGGRGLGPSRAPGGRGAGARRPPAVRAGALRPRGNLAARRAERPLPCAGRPGVDAVAWPFLAARVAARRSAAQLRRGDGGQRPCGRPPPGHRAVGRDGHRGGRRLDAGGEGARRRRAAAGARARARRHRGEPGRDRPLPRLSVRAAMRTDG